MGSDPSAAAARRLLLSADGEFLAQASGEWLYVQPREGPLQSVRCSKSLICLAWSDYGCLWTLDEASVACRRVSLSVGAPFLEFPAAGVAWIAAVPQGLLLWNGRDGVTTLRRHTGAELHMGDLGIGRPLSASSGAVLTVAGTEGAWGASFGFRGAPFRACAAGDLDAERMILFSSDGRALRLECASGDVRLLRWRIRT